MTKSPVCSYGGGGGVTPGRREAWLVAEAGWPDLDWAGGNLPPRPGGPAVSGWLVCTPPAGLHCTTDSRELRELRAGLTPLSGLQSVSDLETIETCNLAWIMLRG